VGGPSQVDTFDYKPELQKLAGKPVPESLKKAVLATRHANVFHGCKDELLASPFSFAQHGRSGMWVSELHPHQLMGSALLGMGRNVLITRATACRACPPAGK